MSVANPSANLPAPAARHASRRAQLTQCFEARHSDIHGRGAFALLAIEPGELVAVYEGKLLTCEEAGELYGAGDGHTFLFARSDGLVIDGGQGGNDSRFINHGCEPNVEAVEAEARRTRIEIRALRAIGPGTELLLDYRLDAEGEDAETANPCRCGAPSCRRTLVLRA